MLRNRSADKRQFEKYKAVLGKDIPETLEDFQKMKYNDSEKWEVLKAYVYSIKSGELSPLADFGLYKAINKEMNDKLIGIVAINKVTITGKSKHAIARTIGSIEQRRNGVHVSDILDALTNPASEILPIRETDNIRSQKIRNKILEVSINPDTGNIIQVNPIHTKKEGKSWLWRKNKLKY